MWALALPLVALALATPSARALQNVTVLRKQLSLEETHALSVDASIEYILDFIPNEEQGRWPMRVWVQADGADGAGGAHPSRPLLVTYRQRAGAGTWQVPQLADAGARLLFELERTLCPEPEDAKDLPDCLGEGEVRGWFSLHVVSACAQDVRLRAAPARDWQMQFGRPLITTATLTAPRVHQYRFPEGQASVRLVVASQDDVCATVAVHAIQCPIAETLTELPASTMRMTVLRSGGVQLSRERFPHGFYVVIMVHENDLACTDEEPEAEDWLVAAAFQPHAAPAPPRPPRRKTLTLDTKASLSRGAYAAAAGGTLALFAGFYLAFGLLVLAQRWPRFARHVAPKAVLAEESTLQSQTDAAQTRRHRRDSTATFDSSDISDSDHSDAEAGTARAPDPAPAPAPAPASAPASARARAPAAASSPRASAAGSPVFIRDAVDTPVSRNGSVNVASSEAPPLSVPDGGPPDAGVTTLDGTAPDVTSLDGTSPNVTPLNGTSNVTTLNGTSPDVTTADSARDAGADTDVVRVISSDGDQQNGQTEADGTQRPWGLPARLRVAALARRRARVLQARSDRYLATLATVAVFYALPVLQFVFSFQIFLNVSGSLDTCYYNFLCAHPAGVVSDFNHVYSNLGYLLLGALFMLQEYGIPPHYGMLSALGAGLMVVALLSASYHICPNRLNFQFDTSFMYVLAVLSMVKIYQSRHPDVNARAHATFGVLAVLIALVVWGVLGGGALFWGVFTVLHVFTFLLLSLRIYYLGQFRFEKETLAMAARGLRSWGAVGALRPLYSARLLLLLVANAVNWAFALFGLIRQSADFASHLLFVLLGNTLVYMAFYLLMKLLHGERPRWYAWAFTAGAAAAWAPALYLFTTGSSSWSATPARSRLLNHECRALAFYDAHDLWHLLSAVALYLSFNAMLTWDDGLTAVRRTDIAVF